MGTTPGPRGTRGQQAGAACGTVGRLPWRREVALVARWRFSSLGPAHVTYRTAIRYAGDVSCDKHGDARHASPHCAETGTRGVGGERVAQRLRRGRLSAERVRQTRGGHARRSALEHARARGALGRRGRSGHAARTARASH